MKTQIMNFSLGSNLSRISLASLICLCMLTIGVGNVWGAAATLPVNYSFTGGNSSLPTGVTHSGLGSNYAAGNSPYLLKFDNNGDYIQIQVDAAAETITIGVKEFGTSGASIQIQGSADGSSFTTIQTLSFSQGQNKTSSQSTNNSISSSYRYFRVKRNSGSNFGLGTLAITKAAASCTKIGAPTVTATPGDGRIDLSWSNQTGASSYSVTKTPAGGTVVTPSKSGSTWSCAITGLTNGTTYTWSVEAVGSGDYCASGNTAASASATPNVFRTITYYDKDGQHTTSLADGTNIATALTALYGGDDPVSCDATNYEYFVGWKVGEISGTASSVTLLDDEVVDAFSPNNNYYAVWSDTDPSAGGWEAATSIAAGDVVVLCNQACTYELNGISTTSTTYGILASVEDETPANLYPLTIEAGASDGTFSFKNGTKYLSWSSGNSLASSTTKNNNSSWTVSISEGVATIRNKNDNTRYLQYNSSGSRFACYTNSQKDVALYKQTSSGTPVYITTCATDPCASLQAPNVTATATENSITLSWEAVSGATSYNIYNFTTDTEDETTELTYTFTGLAPETEYEWEVESAKGECLKGTEGTTTTSATPYTVTFDAGSGTCDDESLTEASGGAGVTLPTANPPAACATDGWGFAGWWTEEVSSTTTSPGELLTAGSNYKPASDCTLYAVYQRTETTQGGGSPEETVDFSSQGYSNEQTISSYTGTDFSVAFNKGSNSNDPKYYNSGTAIRIYGGGYFTISSESTITEIVITFGSGDGTNTITASTGTYSNGTWTGSANSVKFTIGGSTGNRRIKSLAVTTTGGSSTTTTYNSNPKCCTQPKTPLTITADQIELVKSGVVTLTATGGNGTDITWTATGGVLSNQSNTGATLTISDVDATQNITVTATQAENNNDDEVVYCAQEASIDITVKAQWTITFQTNDNGVKNSNSILVTDGESYTMPDISDEYVCNSGSSFAGWVDNEDDTEVDATPNSTQTATADQTWYAAWSSSSNTKSVDIYQLVTNVTNLAAGDEVWITNTTPTVAMGVQNGNNRGQVTVTKHPTENDKIYSTGSPATLTIGKDGTNYTFHDGTGYLYAASSSNNYLRLQTTNNANGKWSITIEDGKATITAQGTNTHNKLKYNSSSSIFSCYESGQGDVRIYKNVGTAEIEVSGASITTNNTSCHRGAVIFAENGKWITSSKGQKVRIAINVTARGFESDATLSATSANEHFSVVSITNTTITKNSAFETQMMIEYQPAEANTNENAEITLVAKKGEEVVATRTIDVNGRSLPDEFVIVAQYNDKWLAVPANMQSGADQYNGIEVTPNNELTQIPAASSTTIYSLRGVADNRYEAAGTCVRLVGNGNKCLWGNAASTNTTIQNWTTLGATNGSNYEWLLTTSDGELYTIANPEHPDYDEGRILSNSGSKYGLYKGTTKFYILPVGCSSLPGNIQVTARRVDATFSWETNASTVTIDLYTNEGMTEGHKTASVTDVPYLFSSLAENTQYWYKLTPDADDDCAVTGTFKTTGPVIDVVEWGENSATIYVDKDEAVDPRIIIAGEVEHGQGGIVATDIFFSKYFEAEGTAKLLAIYNGTANAISLADITILQRTSAKNTPLSLASYGKTAGWIQPGEEIVLFNRDSRDAVMECAENNETYDSWINVEDNNLSFSGKGTIRLFRGNTCIDIIGAMNAGDNAANMNDKTRDPMEGAASPSFGDAKGFVTSFGDNYKTPAEETNYELSTNRCLLIRRAFVTSGDSALLNNFGDFKTLGTYTGVDSKTHKGEWSGLRIPTAVPPETDYIHTCAGFEDAGSFDYNKYYKEFSTISDDKYLSDFTRADDGTYTLSIEYMRQYACMNLKFQLTAHNDPTDVLTEQLVQVPIVVKDARNSNDTLFNNIIKQDVEPHAPMVPESINRCKTCNVVVLGTGTLTKVADGSTNDVAEIRDVKVYPGGKLIIPEGTHYVVNSLALRRQEDVVAAAKINSGLADDPDDITDKGIYIRESNGVYLDVRIDPSKWHYFTLPYDCRVGDVRFADGTPAKVNTDYLISWYDGAYRAEHKTGGWTDITSDDYVLKAGLGYIVALPGSGLIKRELRFPMANNVIAEELGDKTVGGLYAYGGDKTDEELRPNHKGWNMIGNPYLYDYTTDIVTDPLAVGELEHDPSGSSWNGKWVRTGSARYIVAPIDDNGWKGYEQTTISNLRPFMSYFIQVGTKTDGTENPETERSITFDKDQKPASIIRRAQAEDAEPMYPVWYGLELLAPNGEKDNTTLLISNEFTDDYDMMDDLIKMRGSYYNYYQNPVLASRNNSGEMAFNALPDSSAAVIGVPLNYYAYQAGTYTFATDSRYDLEEVKSAMLFDATTQQYYDLLTENHSFSLAKGDNNARFKLYVRVERKKPQITTDVDNLLVDGQLSLIALDKTLVLSGLTDAADIYVYDATGKLIRSDLSASGGGIWRTNVPAQGVYFVRVNSTTSQQTLRTVVK